MLRLLGVVISISLADSMNPSTIGPSLFMASGAQPRRSVLQFALGTFIVFLAGGLILTLGPGRAILALVPKPSATTRYILETIAGAVMLIAAPVFWRRRKRGVPSEIRSGEQPRTRSPAVTAAAIGVVELPTAFPYFAAIAAIVGSDLGLGQQLILLVVYNVCFILPMLAIVAALTLGGEQAVRQLTRARRYMQEHWPVLLSVVALLAGLFVITLGVTGLTLHRPGNVGRFSRHLRHLITR